MSETELHPTGNPPALEAVKTARVEPNCWSIIGVYGNSTCPEMATYVHCRNCPVYSKAALEFLNRPLSAEHLKQWTEHFAQESKSPELSSTSAVPFRIASEWLALPSECFQEITERRPIHSLPHAHQMVLGLANVRGELLLCISMGRLLGLTNVPPRNILRANYGRLLVLHWAARRIGFPADEVHGPHRFYAEDVKPPPAPLAKASPAFAESVLQWQQRTLVLIDPDLLFSSLNRSLT